MSKSPGDKSNRSSYVNVALTEGSHGTVADCLLKGCVPFQLPENQLETSADKIGRQSRVSLVTNSDAASIEQVHQQCTKKVHDLFWRQ